MLSLAHISSMLIPTTCMMITTFLKLSVKQLHQLRSRSEFSLLNGSWRLWTFKSIIHSWNEARLCISDGQHWRFCLVKKDAKDGRWISYESNPCYISKSSSEIEVCEILQLLVEWVSVFRWRLICSVLLRYFFAIS